MLRVGWLNDLLQHGEPPWCEVRTFYQENQPRCRELGVDQQPAFPFQIDLEELSGVDGKEPPAGNR